ncbi:MAG: hypothetical protein RLY49_206 [Candidatus Parcubacteria bacterium]|jgi:RimJ/RimL family protein N-acetyltransferase
MKAKPNSKQTLEPVVFLHGKRLRLRPNDVTDIERYTRWINDEEIRSFLGTVFPTTKLQEEEWLREKQKSSDTVQLAIETNTGVHIGGISIFRINWIDRTAETGTMIGDKKYWSDGYGTEAKMLLLKYAFETLGLRKIHSRAYAYNERSINYSLKCGYKITGRQKEEKFKFGKYHDVVMLEVFYEEWVVAYNAWLKSPRKKSAPKTSSKKTKG